MTHTPNTSPIIFKLPFDRNMEDAINNCLRTYKTPNYNFYTHRNIKIRSTFCNDNAMGRLIAANPAIPTIPLRRASSNIIYSTDDHKYQILDSINSQSVTIIVGSPGCGKTTQIPQYILEQACRTQRPCKIICSQPNRPAAIFASLRVAAEREETIGQTIAYQVKLETKVGFKSCLIYCTHDIILDVLRTTEINFINSITYIIIDEVQMRNKYTHFLMMILKTALTCYPRLKLILILSGTDAQRYKEYFEVSDIVNILKKPHLTASLYEDDIRRIIPQLPNVETKDYTIVKPILEIIYKFNKSATVLIYVPDLNESHICHEIISNEFKTSKIFTLHNYINTNTIDQLLDKSLRTNPKVILLPGNQECNVPLYGQVFVINTGRITKEVYDHATGVTYIQKTWISKNEVLQRELKTRLGGSCFHLFTRSTYGFMSNEPCPDLLIFPLHELCLQAKMFNATQRLSFSECFQNTLETADIGSVAATVSDLQVLGALNEFEQITPLGRHLLRFSVEPRLAKMLIYATIFQCLDPIATIVACLAVGDPFIEPKSDDKKQMVFMNYKQLLAGDCLSDHVALIKAYQLWQRGVLANNKQEVELFSINSSKMQAIHCLRTQLISQLRCCNFISNQKPFTMQEMNANSHCWPSIKAVLTTGCFPNIASVVADSPNCLMNRSGNILEVHKNSLLANTDLIKCMSKCCIVYGDILMENSDAYHINCGTVITAFTAALLYGNFNEQTTKTNFYYRHGYTNLNGLTKALNDAIRKRIANPSYIYSYNEERLLKDVQRILIIEEQQHSLLIQPEGVGKIPVLFPCKKLVSNWKMKMCIGCQATENGHFLRSIIES